MKTLKEFNEQFDIEEKVWKDRANTMLNDLSELMKDADKLPFEEFQKCFEIGMEMLKQMYELDTEHKKFLLRWQRKFKRRNTIDFLKKIFQIRKAET